MRRLTIVLYVALAPAGLASMVARAADNLHFYYSGDDLLRECTSSSGRNQYSCMGYLQGVADTLAVDRILANKNACIEPNVSAAQLRDVIILYLKNNPADRRLPASAAAKSAFTTALTCE